jgi:uncharacterized membrane protein
VPVSALTIKVCAGVPSLISVLNMVPFEITIYDSNQRRQRKQAVKWFGFSVRGGQARELSCGVLERWSFPSLPEQLKKG